MAVLAGEAPELTDALDRVQAEGWSHVILDGKIVDTDRCRAKTTSGKGEQIDLWYSGKRHDFGGNIQVHDLVCAQEHALGALYAAAARGTADPGRSRLQGAGIGVHTPYKLPTDGRRLDTDNRTYNMLLRALRGTGERGFALLVGLWRVLQHVTACPQKIGPIAKAALVLTQFERAIVKTCG